MQDGFRQLESLESKAIHLGGVNVIAQHNPLRARNMANFKRDVMGGRPCFLCPQHLLPGERGLGYGANTVLFGNPFPILPGHFVAVQREHAPQNISAQIGTALNLARDLGEKYFLLYNGPEVGASAPDHNHLQGARRNRHTLPIESDLEVLERAVPEFKIPLGVSANVEAFVTTALKRTMITLRGRNRLELFDGILETIDLLKNSPIETNEPPLNAFFIADKDVLTTHIFPRSRFRPNMFSDDQPRTLKLSPAALEMAGVIVVPRPEDFNEITPRDVTQVYADVSRKYDKIAGQFAPVEHF
jgi:hypothetical protein